MTTYGRSEVCSPCSILSTEVCGKVESRTNRATLSNLITASMQKIADVWVQNCFAMRQQLCHIAFCLVTSFLAKWWHYFLVISGIYSLKLRSNFSPQIPELIQSFIGMSIITWITITSPKNTQPWGHCPIILVCWQEFGEIKWFCKLSEPYQEVRLGHKQEGAECASCWPAAFYRADSYKSHTRRGSNVFPLKSGSNRLSGKTNCKGR